MTTEAAEAARAALRTFVAGFGLAPEQGERLVERLLPGACARWRDSLEMKPGLCATLHAEEALETWLAAVLGVQCVGDQPALPIGRAAFLACGGPAAWPNVMLTDDPLPEGFVAAMRAAAPVLAPLPTAGTMPEQSLETWSINDAGRALGEALEAHAAWLGQARPLITAPIKAGKPIR